MTAKKGRGRPPKFNQEVADKIVAAVRAGNYMETAAAFAGIHKDTLYAWLKEGANKKTGQYRKFSDAVKRALGEAEASDLMLIQKAAKDGVWQAAAWRLERRFRERWGKSIAVEDLKSKSTEELLALLEEADTGGTE
jgi:hypothetical protein